MVYVKLLKIDKYASNHLVSPVLYHSKDWIVLLRLYMHRGAVLQSIVHQKQPTRQSEQLSSQCAMIPSGDAGDSNPFESVRTRSNALQIPFKIRIRSNPLQKFCNALQIRSNALQIFCNALQIRSNALQIQFNLQRVRTFLQRVRTDSNGFERIRISGIPDRYV